MMPWSELNPHVQNELWCALGIAVCIVLIWWGNRRRGV